MCLRVRTVWKVHMDNVQILMATYNGSEFLAQQIDSIRSQTHRYWSLLISDDGSQDDTQQIIEEYAGLDERIHAIDEPNPLPGSAARNFSHLLRHATGDYVMLCDQDDVWAPTKIEVTLRRMHQLEQEVGREEAELLVFTDMAVVDQDGQVTQPSFERYMHIDTTRLTLPPLLAQPLGAGCTMMANKALVQAYQKTPPTQMMSMHDWWLSLIAAGCGRIAYLDVPTSSYRQHGTNSVGATGYSPKRMIANARMIADGVWETVDQARSFREVYGDRVDPAYRDALDAYCAIDDPKISRRIRARLTSHVWKSGLVRRAGELAVTLVGRRRKAS